MRAMPPDFLNEARALIGEADMLTAPEAIAPYLTETRGLLQGQAGVVFRPRARAQVAPLVALAARHRVPMVPHGGNTGLTGAGVPFGGIVIALDRLDRVLEVDPVNATIRVEAGAVLQRVQEAARQAGMLFPLSLGSEGSCTIGGNIATNAGGTAVLRYGNTRDLVLGLEAVLPDGRVFSAMNGLRKDNAGYDLKHLFIGSEGTLGIVTAAVLKLFPLPRARVAAFIGAESPERVVALFSRLRRAAGEALSTFEILPRFGLEIVLRHGSGVRDPLADPYPWYAFAELSAPEADAPLGERLEAVLGDALEAGEVLDAAIGASEREALEFWRIRELLAECQRFEGGSIKHDVSVPISRVADFLTGTIAACEAAMPGIRPCAFGHIGDGNIHFNLSQPLGMDKAAFLAQWHAFNTLVHDAVHARGGSIAAEHGVGLFKRDELPRYRDPVALDLMAVVKRAIDPLNLMNPGKVLRVGEDLPRFDLDHG